MRILFVSDAAGGHGGVEQVNREILSGLGDLGCEVALLRPDHFHSVTDYAGTARVFAFDRSAREGDNGSLSHCIEKFKPHVVHLTGARSPLVSRVDKVVRKVPWVLTFHNLPTLEAPFGFFYGFNFLYYSARNTQLFPNTLMWLRGLKRWRFARVICESQRMRSRLLRLGCRPEQIVLSPAGISNVAKQPGRDAEALGFSGSSCHPRILTIAGIVHHKGLHDSLRAVAGLADTFPSFTYLFIGGKRDQEYASYLQSLVARLGLQSHVNFVYDASEEFKWSALAAADLYIQPSHEEGFCLTFLDAATIVPRLVGTAAGEMPVIAEADRSIAIVSPKDVRGLQANIIRLLRSPTSASDLRVRCTHLRQRYSWKDHIHRLYSLYQELSKNGSSSA